MPVTYYTLLKMRFEYLKAEFLHLSKGVDLHLAINQLLNF